MSHSPRRSVCRVTRHQIDTAERYMIGEAAESSCSSVPGALIWYSLSRDSSADEESAVDLGRVVEPVSVVGTDATVGSVISTALLGVLSLSVFASRSSHSPTFRLFASSSYSRNALVN